MTARFIVELRLATLKVEITNCNNSNFGRSRRNGYADTIHKIYVRPSLLVMQICMHIQQKKKILHRGLFKIHESEVKFWISEGSSLRICLNGIALP